MSGARYGAAGLVKLWLYRRNEPRMLSVVLLLVVGYCVGVGVGVVGRWAIGVCWVYVEG